MLTDTAIRALRPGDRPIKKADGGGLFILVTPEGKKHWRLAYRFQGKQKLLSGGPYPLVKLADARKWRDDAKIVLLAGCDPSEVRKANKRALIEATTNTFEQVTNDWIEARRCAWSPRYTRVVETRLREDIFPALGSKPIRSEDPAQWDAIADAARFERDNREAINHCKQTARKSKTAVNCVVRISS
jgi:Arm DNA-binding domain